MRRAHADLTALYVKSLERSSGVDIGVRNGRLTFNSTDEQASAYKSLLRKHNPVLAKGIGDWFRRGRSQEAFDPKAEDGDGDGIVQDSTPWQRPAVPNVPQKPSLSRRERRLQREGKLPPDYKDPKYEGMTRSQRRRARAGIPEWDDPQLAGMTRRQKRMAIEYIQKNNGRQLTRREQRLLRSGKMPNRRNMKPVKLETPDDGMTRRERRMARAAERARLFREGIEAGPGDGLTRRERRLIREGKLPPDYKDPKYEGLTRRERRLMRDGKLPNDGTSRRERRERREAEKEKKPKRTWLKKPDSTESTEEKKKRKRNQARNMAGVGGGGGGGRGPSGTQEDDDGRLTLMGRAMLRVNEFANQVDANTRADMRALWRISDEDARFEMENLAVKNALKEFRKATRGMAPEDRLRTLADVLDYGEFGKLATNDPRLREWFESVDRSGWTPKMHRIWDDLTNWETEPSEGNPFGVHKPRRGFPGWPNGGRPDDRDPNDPSEMGQDVDLTDFENILDYRIDLNDQSKRPRPGGLGPNPGGGGGGGRPGPTPGGGGRGPRPTPGGGRPWDPADGNGRPWFPGGSGGPIPGTPGGGGGGGRGPRPTPKPGTDFFSEDFDMDPAKIKDIYDVEYLEDLLQRIRAEEKATGERRPELKKEISNQISDINWYEKHKSGLLKGVAFDDVREIRKNHNEMITAQRKAAEARRRGDGAEESRWNVVDVRAKRERDRLIEESVKRGKENRRPGDGNEEKPSAPRPETPGPTPGGGDGGKRPPRPPRPDNNDIDSQIRTAEEEAKAALDERDRILQEFNDASDNPRRQEQLKQDLKKANRRLREANQKVKQLKTKKTRDETVEKQRDKTPRSPSGGGSASPRELTPGSGDNKPNAETPEAEEPSPPKKPSSKKPKRKPGSKERTVKKPADESAEQMALDLTTPEPAPKKPEPSSGTTVRTPEGSSDPDLAILEGDEPKKPSAPKPSGTTTAKIKIDKSPTGQLKRRTTQAKTPEKLDAVRKDVDKRIEELQKERAALQEVIQTTSDGAERVRASERSAAIRSELDELQQLSSRINDRSAALMREAEDAATAAAKPPVTDSKLAKYDQYSADMTEKIVAAKKIVGKMSNAEVEVALRNATTLENEMNELIKYIQTLDNSGEYDIAAIRRNISQLKTLTREFKKRLPRLAQKKNNRLTENRMPSAAAPPERNYTEELDRLLRSGPKPAGSEGLTEGLDRITRRGSERRSKRTRQRVRRSTNATPSTIATSNATSRTSSSASRNIQQMSAEVDRIEAQVIRSFGEIKTKKDRTRALKLAFPNLEQIDLDGGIAGLGRGGDLHPQERAQLIGLLHLSTIHPIEAQNIRKIGTNVRKGAAGQASFISLNGADGKPSFGWALDFHKPEKIKWKKLKKQHDQIRNSSQSYYLPGMAIEISDAVAAGDITPDEGERLISNYIAQHEFAHTIHLSRVMNDGGLQIRQLAGGEPDDAFLEKMHSILLDGGYISTPAPPRRGSKEAQKMLDIFNEKNFAAVKLTNIASHWDALTDEEKREAWAYVVARSQYGAVNSREALAELLALHFSGRLKNDDIPLSVFKLFKWLEVSESKDFKVLLEDILTKAAKTKMPNADDFDICEGITGIYDDE